MTVLTLINLHIFLIFFTFPVDAKSSISSLDCLIHNREYSYEYLYDENDELHEFEKYLKLNIFTTHLSKVRNYEKITWELIPNMKKDAIYLKNKNSNNYLCASNLFLSPMKVRRTLYTSKVKQGDNCLWKLNEIMKNTTKTRNEIYDEDDDDELTAKTYLIWNVKYNQQMYAPTFFFKTDKHRRNVYLWNDRKNVYKSNKFKWVLDCM